MRWRWLIGTMLIGTAAVSCGKSFSASSGGAGGASSSSSGVGGNGGNVSVGTAGGSINGTGGSGVSVGVGAGGGTVSPACRAGQLSSGAGITLHTTLDSNADVEMPAVPVTGMGVLEGGTFVPGLIENALKLDGDGHRIIYDGAPGYVAPVAGTIDFCFRPLHAPAEGKRRYFLSARGANFEWLGIFKNAAGSLIVRLGGPNGEQTGAVVGTVTNIGYQQNEWHRLTVAWNVLTPVVAVYLDGMAQGVTMTGSGINIPPIVRQTDLIIGDPTEAAIDLSPKSELDHLFIYAGMAGPLTD